ncbi:hypothetical protein [Sandaracinus amylolyticus]|uniref:Abnormal spindle-like microcephaly-associated protein ASH domain-containing protein n=1 Tax=Sandaracinus amylolyticus TaxID=927083 RepID=A0A0F6YFT3_9BACT|nr:hypothetical protein [Sandaracinus amylolyticus]AKF03076.1 hypothetical protein DB32_000225 [Sandaracinus amylolyticus]
MTALLRALGLVALLALAGCVGTPQPDPPNLAPERLRVMGGERGGSFLLIGDPGAAIASAPAEVLVANLDAPAMPVRIAPVAADGSFSIELTTLAIDELRIWVRGADGERSAPVDVLADPLGLAPAVRALLCLRVEPHDLVVLGTGAGSGAREVITLVNECDEDVTVESVALRAPVSGVEIEAAPTSVAAGASAAIELRFLPDESAPAGLVEDVLLVTVAGDTERDRRAVIVAAEVR